MKTIWDRIHVWLATNAPEVLASLRPGATQSTIRAAEREMGITLPEDVKACYRIHDGQDRAKGFPWPPGFLFGWEWSALRQVRKDWQSMQTWMTDGTLPADARSEPAGPVRTEYWYPAWIPLTRFNGNHCCLDLAPEPGGAIGQIIDWYNYDNRREIQARSFSEWLSRFADELESGGWWWSERQGSLTTVPD